jgi:hypothetical protein
MFFLIIKVVESNPVLLYTINYRKESRMTEQRKNKRREFGYYMRVLDDKSHEVVGYLSDISSDGFKLDCQKELQIEKDFRLRMDLTAEVANKTTMAFTARSKWRQRDQLEPTVFNVGFEIVKIAPEDARIFKLIMEKYGSKEKSQDLF